MIRASGKEAAQNEKNAPLSRTDAAVIGLVGLMKRMHHEVLAQAQMVEDLDRETDAGVRGRRAEEAARLRRLVTRQSRTLERVLAVVESRR